MYELLKTAYGQDAISIYNTFKDGRESVAEIIIFH